ADGGNERTAGEDRVSVEQPEEVGGRGAWSSSTRGAHSCSFLMNPGEVPAIRAYNSTIGVRFFEEGGNDSHLGPFVEPGLAPVRRALAGGGARDAARRAGGRAIRADAGL